MQLECGKFTGNGTSLDITLKTKRIPDLLFIKLDSGRYGRYKHILQASDISTRFNSATSDSTGVTSLYEGGFSVGNSTDVNQNAIETGYVAFFDDDNGDFEVGTYTGDGNATQVISIDQGFSAEIVFVFDDSGNAIHRSAADSNARLFTSSGAQTTHITAIGTGTFTVGSSLNVSSTTYYYAVFKKVVGKNGSGTYSGSASGQTINFSDASSGVAEYMIVTNQSDSRTQPARADKDYLFNEPNETHSYFTEAWGAYNEILEFNRGSFSVGTSRDANWNGDTYVYFWLSSNPKTDTALPVAVPQQNTSTNPDFIDLSNPSTSHGLNDGLVLHARFIPRLFNIDLYPDLSPQQNDLTLANVASSDLLSDFENGRWGYLDCDGTSGQHGYCPLSDSLELTQLTFAGWVYITDTGIRAILEKREGTTSAWCIYSDARQINVAGSDRSNNVTVTGILSSATWYHVVVTLDSSGNTKGYVNGALSRSDTTDAPGSQPTFPVILGARWDNVGTGAFIRPFQGRLDGIRLYNRVLSADEIADLYRQELAFNPDTIARFNSISLLSYSQDVGPFAAISSTGLVNQNPDFIDLSNAVNRDHPLNRDLYLWYLPIPYQNGFATGAVIDLCSKSNATITKGSGSWVTSTIDWGGFSSSGGGGARFSMALPETYYWTIRVRGIADSTGTGTIYGRFWDYDSSNHSLTFEGSDNITFKIAANGIFANQDIGLVFGEPFDIIIAGDAYNSSIQLFNNGVLKLTSGLNYYWRSGTYIFQNIAAGNRTFDGYLSSVQFWTRRLSNDEIYALYDEGDLYYPNTLNRIPSLLPIAVSEAAGGAYSLTVDSQSITVTGTDASLLYDRILSAESGSFTLTGTAVTLNKGFTLVVDSQAIAITGTDAGVFYNRSLSVDSQPITVTGTDASTLFNRNLSVDLQAITVTGTNASTFYNRVISVESGSVTLSGTAATLTVSGVGNYSITADGKAIALSPTDASLLFNRQISVDTIEITITGTDASVFHNRVINSDSGSVTLVGQDSSLLFDRVLSVDSDSLTITGAGAGVFYNRSLSADGGSFTVSASDVSLLYDRILSADSQAVTVVGTVATLQYSEDIGVYVYVASIAIAKIGSASIGLSNSHDVSITVD